MKFTWNPIKAEKVLTEHKIHFEKIYDIFEDDYSIDFIDRKDSTSDETRFIIIGITAVYGLVHLVYVIPSENEIRFITARKAENYYVKKYEEIIRGN